MKKWYLFLIAIAMLGCKYTKDDKKAKFLTELLPTKTPIVFKEELTPKDKIIHKGIFSPDLEHYYYTLSNKDFTQFDVYILEKKDGNWSQPKKAFFNSQYDDHGMNFSPDGNTIYFSSTRPTNMKDVAETWHIWKSEKVNEKWSKPTYVDVPNLRNKLVSHPVVTNSGTLYFHSSNLDYSGMDIYHAKSINGEYQEAKKVIASINPKGDKCTPYVSPNEKYMIYATVGNQLDLHLSFKDDSGNWIYKKKLSNAINTSGQGNPFVTPDHKYLFYTTGNHQGTNWNIKWVDIASDLEIK
ncbi:hypothetical protein [Kordia sp.]|uniref:hypothetical protein n=1 Tax=Kordia sp. TaxID=1965332 RepID=UPI003B596A8D